MTARIALSAGAPEFTLEDCGIEEFEFGGDEHTTSPNRYASTRNVPGSLWERVAEMGEAGVINSPNYSARIADAYRHAYWRSGGARGPHMRGVSGVIVAGVVREHTN